ncbi:hypothetical protein ABIF74_011669 [Bradyrhizobium japonicum]|jgi:hypothetical protein
MKLAKRIGMRKAKVAIARKIAVILHYRLVAARPHAAAYVEAPDPDIIMRRSRPRKGP